MTGTGRPARHSTSRPLTAAVGVLALAAICISMIEGTPQRLPGVALESAVLLHAERALALFAAAIAVLTVLAQAARGRLPIELTSSGLRYEADAADVAATAVTQLQAQVDDLVTLVDALADRLDVPPHRP